MTAQLTLLACIGWLMLWTLAVVVADVWADRRKS